MNLGKYLERPAVETDKPEAMSRRYSDSDDVPVPEGFRRMSYETVYYKKIENNTAVIRGVAYHVPADSLMATDEGRFKAFYIRPVSGSPDSIYVVKAVEFTKTSECIETDNIEGYLYMK